MSNSPIPVTILTGFLGAGKTTLLNRILHADHGLRIAVLINDFGEINIDSKLVMGVEENDTIQLSNGCICCTIREDLLDAVEDIVDRPEPPDYIIIESSGVADPGPVATSFAVLRDLVEIDAIIAMLDADQHHTLPDRDRLLAVNQIGVADIVVINKVDLAEAHEVERLHGWINQLTPRARILETTFADVPLEYLLGVGMFDLSTLQAQPPLDIHVHEENPSHGHSHDAHSHHDHSHDAHSHNDHHHHDHSLIYSTWSYQTTQPLDYKLVQKALNQLPVGVFRAKGMLHLDGYAQSGVLQIVGKRSRITFGEPWGAQLPETVLVFIGEPGAIVQQALDRLFDSTVALG